MIPISTRTSSDSDTGSSSSGRDSNDPVTPAGYRFSPIFRPISTTLLISIEAYLNRYAAGNHSQITDKIITVIRDHSVRNDICNNEVESITELIIRHSQNDLGNIRIYNDLLTKIRNVLSEGYCKCMLNVEAEYFYKQCLGALNKMSSHNEERIAERLAGLIKHRYEAKLMTDDDITKVTEIVYAKIAYEPTYTRITLKILEKIRMLMNENHRSIVSHYILKKLQDLHFSNGSLGNCGAESGDYLEYRDKSRGWGSLLAILLIENVLLPPKTIAQMILIVLKNIQTGTTDGPSGYQPADLRLSSLDDPSFPVILSRHGGPIDSRKDVFVSLRFHSLSAFCIEISKIKTKSREVVAVCNAIIKNISQTLENTKYPSKIKFGLLDAKDLLAP